MRDRHDPAFLMMHLGFISHMHRNLCVGWFGREGITRGMPPMLKYLKEHPGCIQRELAHHHHMDPGSVTSVLGLMQTEGLIERRPSQGDKRKLHVFLTELGEKKANLLDERHAYLEQVSFEGFSQEERDAFAGYLVRISDNLKRFANSGEASPHHHKKGGKADHHPGHHPHEQKEETDD